jgi:putative DNA primase/helicase
MSEDVFSAAVEWLTAGFCVLPAAVDGSKRPGLAQWKVWQTRRPELVDIAVWFGNGHGGMGVVCGEVSGYLEMSEFEGRACVEGGELDQAERLVADAGLGELWEQICHGYREVTPTGGVHLFYRIADGPVPGNTKVARRPATEAELAENPTDRIKVLIETRGEGGWVVTAPSNGTTHPTGRPWRVDYGSPAGIATITLAQRDALMKVLSTLDQMPVEVIGPITPAAPPAQVGGELRAGDDFEARTSWEEILVPHGWTQLHTDATGTTYWLRPGKTDRRSKSASTGNAGDRDRLYVFSSSTVFEPEKPYTKFGAYALLEHGGDHGAAAKTLRGQGFGDDTSQQALIAAVVSPASLDAALRTAPALSATAGMPENPTEKQIARYVAQTYGSVLQLRPDSGAGEGWHAWNGMTWEPQHRHGLQHVYADLALGAIPNPKGLVKWGSHATGMAVEQEMRNLPALQHSKEDWDVDAHLLNTPGGIVDLRTGAISPHDPARYCTRITAYAPDPLARAPRFVQFLTETFLGDAELLTYVHRLFGYSLFGHNDEHVIPLCHGVGRNGKSLLLNTILHIVGTYGVKANSEWFMYRRNGAHDSEAVTLEGARFVFTSEINDTSTLDEARLKEYTGGEKVTARRMYSSTQYAFMPRCTIWMLANQRPTARQGGESLFRRMREIPFKYLVPESSVDIGLGSLFQTPEYGAAITSWLIAGAVDYTRHGLTIPEGVKAATAEYAAESGGAVGMFLDERCRLGGGDMATMDKSVLHNVYLGWCNEQGIDPLSKIMFSKALKSAGVGDGRSMTARRYTNITLLNLGDGDGEEG